MMSDDGYAPRSSRHKKKSALSKLAARKKVDDSDELDSDREYSGRFKSHDIKFADTDLEPVGNYRKGTGYDNYENQSSPRNKYGSQYATDEDKYNTKYSSHYGRSEDASRDRRKYPVDADVEVRPSSRFGMHSANNMSDSDEGIEMGHSKGSYSSNRNVLSERSNLRKLEPIKRNDKDSDDDDDKYSKRMVARSRYKVDKKLGEDENVTGRRGNLSDEGEFSGSRNLSNKYRTTSPDKYGELNGKKSYLSKYDESYVKSGKYDDSYTKSNKYDEPYTKSNKYDESYTKSNKFDNSYSKGSKYDEPHTKPNKYEDSYTKSRGLYGKYKLGDRPRGYGDDDDDDHDDKLGDTATERDLQKEYESLLSSSRSRGFAYNNVDEEEQNEYMDRPTPLSGRGVNSPVHKQRTMKKSGTSGSLGSGIFSSQDHPWSSAIQSRGQDDEMSQGSITSNSSVVQLMTTKAARQRYFFDAKSFILIVILLNRL